MRTAQAVRILKCAPALADCIDQSSPCAPLGSNPHGQTMQTAFAARTARTFKDHSSKPSGRSDPKARPVQTIRSFMLQRARFIMLLKARRWPVSSQDLPERVIILFTMSNNPPFLVRRGKLVLGAQPADQSQGLPQGTPALRRNTRTTIRSKPKASRRIGGARRDRTDDLLNANQALSQLSYGPIFAQRRWIGTNRPQNIRTRNA
jgi:hypothetical protein